MTALTPSTVLPGREHALRSAEVCAKMAGAWVDWPGTARAFAEAEVAFRRWAVGGVEDAP